MRVRSRTPTDMARPPLETMSARTPRASLRTLPVADKVMLALFAACFLIAIGRLVVVATTVPYLDYARQAAASAAENADAPPEVTDTLGDFLQDDPAFMAWWGDRLVPLRQGHDYLQVLSQRSYRRTLGSALGTIIEEQNTAGAEISRVIVPEDNDALVGGGAATYFTTAEGEKISARWASVKTAAKRFTEVDVDEVSYDPVLTDAEVAQLESTIGLVRQTEAFRLGSAPEAASGTWVLYAHVIDPDKEEDREFLLIPAEADPKGVAR